MPLPSPPAVRDAVFWFHRQEPPLPPLQGNTSADVVVVGGGMMGLMAARTLTARGVHVALVESATCGRAASGRSSGFITPDSELEFQDLERHFGPAPAATLWEFALGGVELIRTAIREEEIACDAADADALFVASTKSAATTIADEHAARQRAGFASALCRDAALRGIFGGEDYFAGLRFGGTFGIDAHRCCIGLRRALLARGARVYEQSPVVRLSADGVATANGAIRARHVLVCTDRLLPELGLARREIYHAQTFLAITEPLLDTEVARIFPAGPLMVWDTALVYRYFRLTGERRLLIGGGTLPSTYARRERHRPAEVARRCTRYLARHFPGLAVRFVAAWPGLIGISKDFAPVLGRAPHAANVRFAGGAAGLPWAAALGRYLAESLLGQRSEMDGLLGASRKFPIGAKLQAVIGRQPAFALSHGIMKLR